VTFQTLQTGSSGVANRPLMLPTEDARMECLVILVHLSDALSMSANGHQTSVPLSGFMSHTEEFLIAFGPNADSSTEEVFADQSNNSFKLQGQNKCKVLHKQHTSQNERNACRAKHRPPVLNKIVSDNLHLVDERNWQAQCCVAMTS
jgi:hypothetical protein